MPKALCPASILSAPIETALNTAEKDRSKATFQQNERLLAGNAQLKRRIDTLEAESAQLRKLLRENSYMLSPERQPLIPIEPSTEPFQILRKEQIVNEAIECCKHICWDDIDMVETPLLTNLSIRCNESEPESERIHVPLPVTISDVEEKQERPPQIRKPNMKRLDTASNTLHHAQTQRLTSCSETPEKLALITDEDLSRSPGQVLIRKLKMKTGIRKTHVIKKKKKKKKKKPKSITNPWGLEITVNTISPVEVKFDEYQAEIQPQPQKNKQRCRRGGKITEPVIPLRPVGSPAGFAFVQEKGPSAEMPHGRWRVRDVDEYGLIVND